uniref:Sulfide:quinone oxidoreductase, mitochondrial n=1 Tax=Ascaris lumbricoides TaxID=6252 RepID=A0A0M3IPI6_ASCLU
MVAPGLELRYDMVEGLPEALKLKGVNSIYLPELAQKTDQELHSFKGGHALFTFPNTPIKCAGAPQKIMYISDEIFRQIGVRDKTKITYCTSLGRVFGIKKYADALMKIVESKNIELNVRRNLIKVDPITRTATFEILDDDAVSTGKTVSFKYDFLHAAPPCSPVKPLRDCHELTDNKGWLDVDPDTLLSKKFDNVFGMGDCLNTSNAKTGAAISSQMRVMSKNLPALLHGKPLTGKYDGYASCPLMVAMNKYDGYASCPLMVAMNKVILAEFNSDGPLETLPINGAKPRYSSYLLKRYFLPFLYWNFLIKGLWLGPKTIRKILHLGFSK